MAEGLEIPRSTERELSRLQELAPSVQLPAHFLPFCDARQTGSGRRRLTGPAVGHVDWERPLRPTSRHSLRHRWCTLKGKLPTCHRVSSEVRGTGALPRNSALLFLILETSRPDDRIRAQFNGGGNVEFLEQLRHIQFVNHAAEPASALFVHDPPDLQIVDGKARPDRQGTPPAEAAFRLVCDPVKEFSCERS